MITPDRQATIEKIARIIAKALVDQNHMLELDSDGMGYFDEYDNKGYDCRPIAEAIIDSGAVESGPAARR